MVDTYFVRGPPDSVRLNVNEPEPRPGGTTASLTFTAAQAMNSGT